ncbi:Shedu anti-phage system protein SduA domain-containing protein, partial [Phormidesmis sp. 146-12]
ANCRTWDTEGATAKANKYLQKAGINTVQPSGILIIGNTAQLGDEEDRITSFELYRSNLNNPKILTFDELYARAEYIVNSELERLEADEPADGNPANPD